MVNVEYYKSIIRSHPIKDVIITQTVSGITVKGVSPSIENVVCLNDEFKSGKVRIVQSSNTWKFTAIDTIEYIKLSELMNELNRDDTIDENGLPILDLTKTDI
uniref:Uncharacterized protein n=1 Tax=Pithovirus LCPAC406 TaxID=2506599 RepID=A0A481ZH12_9VIRU|nr:MAG: hypothetical protein LCPAC406_02830 [Pithovirus LCPAC406]